GLLLLYVFAGFSCYEKLVQRDYIRCRRTLVMVLAVSVSSLLTPYGVYSALLVYQVMNMKFLQANVIEWMPPNFQAYPVFLWYLVALVTAMAGLGVSMRGPRLVAFGMMLYFGLSHTRGLVMFILIVPIFLARPISLHAPGFGAEEGGDAKFARTPDPVLGFLQKRPFTLPAISLALAAVVTAYSWDKINIGPPKSITPSAAVEFIQRAGIA